MKIERNYEFRQRMDIVHRPETRDPEARPRAGEIVIDESWCIVSPAGADVRIANTAADLQDYFRVAQQISLKILPEAADKCILLTLDETLEKPLSYRLTVEENKITIAGKDPRGVRFGGVGLEDILNFREAPFIAPRSTVHERLFTPRMVHSGWGIDEFPDSHLNAMLHSGLDTAVVFTTGVDQTNVGYLDINDVIQRAKNFGLDTMLYGYLPGYKHPDDPDAQEFFESVYTNIFNHYPDALGIMLVGESGEFPSKDPETTGKRYRESVIDGIPDFRPSPGWWPCKDYPKWIARVRDAVHKAAPNAMIVFNTYNWFWVDEERRKEFLRNFPEDVYVQITYDIGMRYKREGIPSAVMDYSLFADKPGDYFTSESRNAHSFGIKPFSTSNCAGSTWDFGDIPYLPTPQRWITRFKYLDQARRDWDVSRFYDNHHYGWWQSVVTDLGKGFFQSPQEDPEELLKRIAVRYFGSEAAPAMLEGWAKWSEAMGHYTPGNEDQYGPFRVGPSYPFIFQPNITRTMGNKEIKFPTAPHAHFGWKIIKTFYQPYENKDQFPGRMRYPAEVRSLEKMLALWDEGLALMKNALPLVPERKKERAEREINLGEFIRCAIITGTNIKRWWLLNNALVSCDDPAEALKLLDKIEELAYAEIDNARSAIPFVEQDSRLGWEPSMEYVCDKWHLEWKIRQVKSVIDGDIAGYRGILNLK